MSNPLPPDLTPELGPLEEDLQTRIDQAIAAAIAAGLTGAALLATQDELTDLVTEAAEEALHLGHTTGQTVTGQPAPEPDDEETQTFLRDLTIAAGILFILEDAARTLPAAEDPTTHLGQTVRRLWRDATTKLNAALNEGLALYARTTGMDLVWTTSGAPNVCPLCRSMAGTVIAPTNSFAGDGFWDGFTGLPPAHPNCGCRPLPRRR